MSRRRGLHASDVSLWRTLHMVKDRLAGDPKEILQYQYVYVCSWMEWARNAQVYMHME